MNHYKAKTIAEQELQEILEFSGFMCGDNLTNQSEIIASSKPLYYHIEPHDLSDSANVDNACIFAVYRQLSSESSKYEDSSDFINASYTLTITLGGNEIITLKYMDKLLDTLENNDWIYNFISEDKVKNINGSIKPLVQLSYSLDKVIM